MLLMVEKGIRGGTCNAIRQYEKANNKYMKDYDKNKESSHLSHWNRHNLYGWAMSQKLWTFNFKWVKDTSQFNGHFVKNNNKKKEDGYFLEVNVQYPEKLFELCSDLPFWPGTKKLKKVENLGAN